MGKWKQAHRRWLDPDYFGDDDENFITLPTGERVLRDGGRMKISMMAMDSADEVLKATAADMQRQRGGKQRHSFSDADARRFGLSDGRQMHRPGWRFNTDAAAAEKIALAHAVHDCEDEEAYRGGRADAVVSRTSASDGVRDERQAAYLDYERELSLAYLLPTHNERTGEGSHGPLETRKAGSRCTVRGQNGHLVDVAGKGLVCVPDEELGANVGSRDSRPVADIMRDHRERMADIYAQVDAEREQEWRGGK